jgi:hypothetical protein
MIELFNILFVESPTGLAIIFMVAVVLVVVVGIEGTRK